MQLILAIVADQQQAAQLAALIDGRLAVDLVQAAEVGEGLLALDDRVPDLILTSPLMSPFDDGVLDEYLRDLGPAGAHVQTIRIPVLSQAPKKAPRLGFSLRRRAKPAATTPDGCDPKVFADEIALYLARAAEEKQHAATNDTAPVIERRAVQEEVTSQPVSEEQWRPAYSSEFEDLETPIYEPVPLKPDTTFEVEPIYEPVRLKPDTTLEPVSLEPDTTPEPVRLEADATPEPVEELAAEPVEVIARPEPAHVPAPLVAEDDPDSHKASPSFKAALAAIRAAWGKPNSTQNASAPVQQAVAAMPKKRPVAVPDTATPLEIDLTGAVELLDVPSTEPENPSVAVPGPFVPTDSPETPDVYELSVASEMNEVAPSVPEPSGDRRRKPAKRATKPVKAKSPRPSQPKSAQDEWGVFDPNRCGFAALVDKLDEEVSDEKGKQQGNSGKSRVLSCS